MVKEKTTGLSHDFIIHPGETLMEIIKERKMSQKELAIRCGVSEKHVSTVLNCKKNISPFFARRLEFALGIDSIFWINLQSNYDNELTRFEEINGISKMELDVLDSINDILSDYKKNNLIPSNLDEKDEVMELRKIFNVSNLLSIKDLEKASTNESPYIIYAKKKYSELIK